MTLPASRRRAWMVAALLVGLVYVVIGRVFALPVHHVRAWRWAAWVASGGVFALHLWVEHFRLENSPRVAALHAALAAAIGGFGLAVAGMIHSWTTTSAIGPAWLIALIAWPAITAIPAFVAALVAGALLARWRRR